MSSPTARSKRSWPACDTSQVKAGEKAVLQFSCVKKEHVPEGTAAIEAEMITVGFADTTEKKAEFYWTNPTIAPDVRKKGAK